MDKIFNVPEVPMLHTNQSRYERRKHDAM